MSCRLFWHGYVFFFFISHLKIHVSISDGACHDMHDEANFYVERNDDFPFLASDMDVDGKAGHVSR